jgi:hypothetical protein
MSQSKAMLQGVSCPECGARGSMAWDARGYLVCRRRCGGYLLAPTPGSGPTPCALRCGAFASWWEETQPRHPAWLAAGVPGEPDMTLDPAGGLWRSPPADRLQDDEATLVLRPGQSLEQARRGREHHVTNARLRLRHGAPPVYARAVKAALEYALRSVDQRRQGPPTA